MRFCRQTIDAWDQLMIEFRGMVRLFNARVALSGSGRLALSFRIPRIPTMMRPAKIIFAVAGFLWLSGVNLALALEPIRLARTPVISPDVKQIAFSYLGD